MRLAPVPRDRRPLGRLRSARFGIRACYLPLLLLIGPIAASPSLVQEPEDPSVVAPSAAAPVVAEIPEASSWSFSTTVTATFPSGSQNYLRPTVIADRDRLHLEARYNYEGLHSGSAWVGYKYSAGTAVHLDFTAMAGGVFGQTHGYAPGYEFTLSWRKLELYSEAEYLIDTDDSSHSFFYTWSELTLAPKAWFQFGMVVQRTKAYQTDLDVQRGLIVRFTHTMFNIGAYVLDPDQTEPTYGLEANVTF
jgi:hypothetical protein